MQCFLARFLPRAFRRFCPRFSCILVHIVVVNFPWRTGSHQRKQPCPPNFWLSSLGSWSFHVWSFFHSHLARTFSFRDYSRTSSYLNFWFVNAISHRVCYDRDSLHGHAPYTWRCIGLHTAPVILGLIRANGNPGLTIDRSRSCFLYKFIGSDR